MTLAYLDGITTAAHHAFDLDLPLEPASGQLLPAGQPAQLPGAAVKALQTDAKAARLPSTIAELFRIHASWCAEEVAVMLGTTHEQALQLLEQAQAKGELISVDTRNGSVWRRP